MVLLGPSQPFPPTFYGPLGSSQLFHKFRRMYNSLSRRNFASNNVLVSSAADATTLPFLFFKKSVKQLATNKMSTLLASSYLFVVIGELVWF